MKRGAPVALAWLLAVIAFLWCAQHRPSPAAAQPVAVDEPDAAKHDVSLVYRCDRVPAKQFMIARGRSIA